MNQMMKRTVVYLLLGWLLGCQNLLAETVENRYCDPEDESCLLKERSKRFPDIGYATYGYNILNGNPHANGHDPGFTKPIFSMQYETKTKSADYRYMVPDGYHALPDVACTTSFTSKTVTSSKQMSQSLSTKVTASGGGWGASFSASVGYKESSSKLESGKSIYIISSASCTYYFTSIDTLKPPGLDKEFEQYATDLDPDNNDQIKEFIKYYGTHFMSDVVFGARYTHTHEMSTESFQSMSSQGIDVSMAASYSGAIDVGAGFNLDSKQAEQASNFSQQVTTLTTTIGAAPPSGGDALVWASTIKDNPLPVKYKLVSIEDLFTETYMAHTNIKYQEIRTKLLEAKHATDDQDIFKNDWITVSDVIIVQKIYRQRSSTESICIRDCMQDPACMAVQYCPEYCNKEKSQCLYYAFDSYNDDDPKQIEVKQKEGASLHIFDHKITKKNAFTIYNANIVSSEWLRGSVKLPNSADCKKACNADPTCVAIVYCQQYVDSWCLGESNNCLLFSKSAITNLESTENTNIIFISKD